MTEAPGLFWTLQKGWDRARWEAPAWACELRQNPDESLTVRDENGALWAAKLIQIHGWGAGDETFLVIPTFGPVTNAEPAQDASVIAASIRRSWTETKRTREAA